MAADEFLSFAAEVLGVPARTLSLETAFGSIPQWDSLAQLRLVTAIAERYGVEIPFADVPKVRSLWEFRRRVRGESVKKAVAVDLDNTLWQGVVGEDGPEGIRPNVAFEQTLKELKDRGILLVALSKNNREDAEKGLRRLTVLSADDFVLMKIDWRSKAENLADAARELNLGADAFVFVDDRPSERLEMSLRLPEVTVAEFPPELSAYFPPCTLTDEDRRKTEEYREEAARSAFRRTLPKAVPPKRLFKLLQTKLAVHPVREAEFARVAQLSQKANQFAVCTGRYDEASLRRLAAEGLVVTAHAADSFGELGLIAFAVVRDGVIEDWTMSCRAAGRGIEERFEQALEKLLSARGMKTISARWRRTAKNAPVRQLFDQLGFACTSATEEERHYEKCLRDRA